MNAPTPASTSPALGSTPLRLEPKESSCDHVTLDGQPYVRILNVDAMEPFFMSIVGSSDVWLYIGSNAAFTAGRVDPDHAMFPYETVDHILHDPNFAGVATCFIVERGGGPQLWEPWRESGRLYDIQRNLYKHDYGTAVVFEEVNHDLGLTYRWTLSTCDRYGLVRRCVLENTGSSPVQVRALDGWNRIIPAGVDCRTYREMSYLAEAYMRHERLPGLTAAVFTLNAGISDRPEPAESLKTAFAWSTGHHRPSVLLSRRQRKAFLAGQPVADEQEIRGELGMYWVADTFSLAAGAERSWTFVADTGLDHGDVVDVQEEMRSPERLQSDLATAVEENTSELRRRMAAADGLQQSGDVLTSVHHFANVLFNCMRGGVLPASMTFPGDDFAAFARQRNPELAGRHRQVLDQLPEVCTLEELDRRIGAAGDRQLARLAGEYLPLTFSRRHGDPSRPWNWFAIRLKDETGRAACNYEGNWRDIFQNWEALGRSFPAFLERMVHVFLNASTADGYNPYRVNRGGIDWETEEPGNSWANIGYWGDHQLIYLLRLLESLEKFHPGELAGQLAEGRFSYARVPYRIASFDEICRNPRSTLTFLHDLDRELKEAAKIRGNDAKLVQNEEGDVLLVSLAEKLLVPLLVKLSNLVPEGGIWLNTQRPEWNDANNALAGWGLSMVTVYHVRRYLSFCRALFSGDGEQEIPLTPAVAAFLDSLTQLMAGSSAAAAKGFTAEERYQFLRRAGEAGETHREAVYAGSSLAPSAVHCADVLHFIDAALPVIDATIRANRTETGLYHSYNTLDLSTPGSAIVHPLFPMLEGQVALLGAGLLSASEAIGLLEALRASDLYRADQHSYLLYPDRDLSPFLARNDLPAEKVKAIGLLARMLESGDARLVCSDACGGLHFHGDLSNARDLDRGLEHLRADRQWGGVVEQDRQAILDLWEETFQHRAFTGRSGTFFAFEGLGSIYWHMIAKLLLAVQECHDRARETPGEGALADRLAVLYQDVREGLGFRKTPAQFGAFPTDPYSHTPAHRGAQQPGMTGQVKEEVLTRWGELGVRVQDGCVSFDPHLLPGDEFTESAFTFRYVNLRGDEATYAAPPSSLCFTYTQVPVCYVLAEEPFLEVDRTDGTTETFPGRTLSRTLSQALFARSGEIQSIRVQVKVSE